jgi:hypothetical protein
MKSTPIYVELIRKNISKILIFVLHRQIDDIIDYRTFIRIMFFRLDAPDKISDVMSTTKSAARYTFEKNTSESF